MKLLKIFFVVFVFWSFASIGQAQTQVLEPKFGVGISLGVPSSIHFLARDVGVRGLAIRADFGGLGFMFAYAQIAVNVEYHFAQPYGVGFYFGGGVLGFDLISTGDFASGIENIWQLGLQIHGGLELGPLWVELGVSKDLSGLKTSNSGFFPHVAVGLQFLF
jgi:hypothetical protein